MSEVLESLFVLGTSHHATPLEVRERFALTEAQASDLQKQLHTLEGIRECLVLNTCNRLEIYCLADSIERAKEISSLICDKQNVPSELYQQFAYSHNNLEALQHLLEVSAGLDSQMVGETEILGQLKQAYVTAREAHCTGKVLNRLFEKSFQAAKVTRTQTGITRGKISIGNVTVDLASRIFGKLGNSRVLLLGSGEVGEKTAQALKTKGVTDITVSGRSKDKTDLLAEKFGASSIHFENFKNQIQHFDIVITSTSAPDLIINADTIQKAIKNRPNRPLFLIDLAVPRDIEESTAKLENVYLYNLDALANIANENIALRKSEIAKAMQMIKAQAWNYWLQAFRRSMFQKHQ